MFLAASFTSSFVFTRLQSAFTFFHYEALAFSILGLEDKCSAKPSENVADRVGSNLGLMKLRLAFPACVSLHIFQSVTYTSPFATFV